MAGTKEKMKSISVSSSLRSDYREYFVFVFYIALTFVLSMINLPTLKGFHLHFFQIAIFLAAFNFGPVAGGATGFIGSLYSAMIMHNPYIAIGNGIFGFFVGLFSRNKKISKPLAVLLSFLVFLPWLFGTDYFLIHLPLPVIKDLIISLFVSNILWSFLALYIYKLMHQANGSSAIQR